MIVTRPVSRLSLNGPETASIRRERPRQTDNEGRLKVTRSHYPPHYEKPVRYTVNRRAGGAPA